VAELAAFITKRAEQEKAALQQLAAAQKAQVLADGETQAKSADAQAGARAAGLDGSIQAKKASVTTAVAGARSAVQQQIATAKGQAAAEETRARGAANKAVADRKRAALTASGKEADAALKIGRDEAARVRQSGNEVKGRILSMAKSKASAFTAGSAKAVQAGRDAINSGAQSAIAKLDQNTQDAASEALSASAKVSQKIRDDGRAVEGRLGGAEKLDESLRAATAGALKRIDAAGTRQLAQIDAARTQALTSLDGQRQGARRLDGDGKKSAQTIRAAARSAAEKIDKVAAERARAIDKAKQDALAGLAGAKAPLSPQDVARLRGAADQMFTKAGADAKAALLDASGKAKGKLGEAGGAVAGPLAQGAEKGAAGAQGVLETLNTGLQAQKDAVAKECAGALADQKAADDEAVKKLDESLGGEVEKAQQGWAKQREDFAAEAKAKVDKTVAGQLDLEAKLPEQLDDAAKKAADEAEGSILKGIWHGIVGFLKGLFLFIGAVLIVLVIVLAFVSGVGEALVIAIAIVSVIMLIVGIVQAFIRRWGDLVKMGIGDAPWWIKAIAVVAILGIAVADAFGIGALMEGIVGRDLVTGRELSREERAERFTQGALTILFMFLLRGVVKGIKGKGSGPTETPTDPEIKPGEKPPSPEAKPGEPDPALSAELSQVRSSLSDPRAIEAFDEMFQRMGKDPAKMKRALDGMKSKAAKAGKTLEQLLAEEWARKHPERTTPPDDATVARIDAIIDRANQLKAEVDAYKKANPDVKGTNEWQSKLDGSIDRLNKMRSDYTEAQPKQPGQPDGLRGETNNLDGIEAELRTAQGAPGVTRVNADQAFKTSDGRTADADVVADNGKTWIQVKSVEPFGKESSNWTDMQAQASRLVDAAKNNLIDGKAPRVVFRFTKGVSPEVAALLRGMGIEVQGTEVPPPTPPAPPGEPVVGPVPQVHDDDKSKAKTP
jgi:VIT1/CCC1 family predicted Fe2+/Mn2+ transporter